MSKFDYKKEFMDSLKDGAIITGVTLGQGGHPSWMSWKSWNCPGIFFCPGKCPGIHKKGPVSWKLGFLKFLFVLEFF